MRKDPTFPVVSLTLNFYRPADRIRNSILWAEARLSLTSRPKVKKLKPVLSAKRSLQCKARLDTEAKKWDDPHMDPATNIGEFALLSAARWICELLVGRVGTATAVIAIAWLGISMLQGRLALRDGIRVLMGCFILFGAPAIAKGLLQVTEERSGSRIVASSQVSSTPVVKHSAPQPFDPYAGASVPN